MVWPTPGWSSIRKLCITTPKAAASIPWPPWVDHNGRGYSPSVKRLRLQSANAACKLISMSELPDIAAYITALEARIVAQPIERVRLASPFLLRTADPPITNVEGRVVRELRRIGKRIRIGGRGDLWMVLHLMIAGRLHWRPPAAKLAGRQ